MQLVTMPSLEGLKTWFDYELLITGLAILLLVAIWGMNQITGYVRGLPLTSPEFALGIMAIGFGTILLLIWLAGSLNEQ
ncbi:hypothetical protein BDK88_4247 [Natrinema hispanicum]|uniref:Uncharacterized protein n=1 Tax=Natrinema hispanicum TaxID=392421 RepID=A0A482Y350_9EURY|nr:hypothetical protein BDK88_4247 [Natrinema hispanicum]